MSRILEVLDIQKFFWAVVIGAVVYAFIVFRKRKRFVELIDKLPGPKGWPFVGNLKDVGLLTRVEGVNPLAIYLQHRSGLCKIYSKEQAYRVWMGRTPFVIIYKPETFETILSSSTLIDKGWLYDLVTPWLGKGLLTSSGNKWRNRRKQLTPAFHFRILQDFLPVMNSNAKKLVSKMRESMTKDDFLFIDELLVLCTLDIICETAMGVSVNALEESNSKYVTSLRKLSIIVMERSERPWLWPDFFFARSQRGKRFYKNLEIVLQFTRQVIKDRKDQMIANMNERKTENLSEEDALMGNKKRIAFLDLLLEMHLQDNTISEEDIREEVDTFMFEGHDTTAYGLSWLLYLIGSHPEIQDKIHEELDHIFGNDREREITVEDLKEMKYLEYALKESLRIMPSVPLIARQLTEDIVVDGRTIPKGTVCQLFNYQLHRNDEIFPNPELFDPERFLPENCAHRHPYAYVPFSAGPRNCIGQKFALTEEKVITATVLRTFKLKSLDPRDKVQLLPELILKSQNHLRLSVQLR